MTQADIVRTLEQAGWRRCYGTDTGDSIPLGRFYGDTHPTEVVYVPKVIADPLLRGLVQALAAGIRR